VRRLVLVIAVCLAAAFPAAAFDHFNNFNLSGNASPGAFPNTPLGPTNSLEATMGYTLDAHDTAQVTISMTGVPYEAKAATITKGVGVVKVRFSALCNPATPATQTVNEVVLKMWDSAKNEITSARSAEKVSLTFTCPATAVGVAKPDLVFTSYGFEKLGVCAPGQMVYRFSVGVKNQGTATWAPDKRPVVVVKDMHLPNPDDWGTGVAIDPPIAVGETRQMKIDVLYYAADPAHMAAPGTHPFRASVNDNKVVDESRFDNNIAPGPVTWNGIPVIQMSGLPPNCPPPAKPTLAPRLSTGAAGRVAPLAPTPTPVPIR
jgi:hypothetical protein